MLPETDEELDLQTDDLEELTEPGKTYQMLRSETKINGYCDNLEAVKQAIYKILNTERYQSIIYDWNYGVELRDLIGEPPSYVIPEIKRRITEALEQDDRIDSVDSFEFDSSTRGAIGVKFTVHTIYGDIEEEKGVDV